MLIVWLDRRRRNVIGATPRHELFLAELLERLLLVLALERTVMTLIEPPRPSDRNPQSVGEIQCDLGGPDRSPENAGVQDIGQVIALCQQFATTASLGLTDIGEADVDPPGEEDRKSTRLNSSHVANSYAV